MEIVVLVDDNWGIGYAGDQLVRIKEDLQNFKNITENGIVIYGRKTLETFPKGKVLKNRENWVLSKTVKKIDGAVVFNDIASLLKEIKNAETEGEKLFCIGGTEIYKQLLPYVNICYVSKVHKTYENVDRYFPNLDEDENWCLAEKTQIMYSDSADVYYSFNTYVRK